MKIPKDQVESIIDSWPVGRLATLDVHGAPAIVPIVFCRSGDYLWSPVDGKPKGGSTLARLKHIKRDPRVSLLIDYYEADWHCLWWIRITGDALVCQFESDEGLLASIEQEFRKKYPQYLTTPLFYGKPTLIRIAIETLRSWCFSEEGFSKRSISIGASGPNEPA